MFSHNIMSLSLEDEIQELEANMASVTLQEDDPNIIGDIDTIVDITNSITIRHYSEYDVTGKEPCNEFRAPENPRALFFPPPPPQLNRTVSQAPPANRVESSNRVETSNRVEPQVPPPQFIRIDSQPESHVALDVTPAPPQLVRASDQQSQDASENEVVEDGEQSV